MSSSSSPSVDRRGDNNISYLECVAPKKIQWIKLYAFHSLDYVDIITCILLLLPIAGASTAACCTRKN